MIFSKFLRKKAKEVDGSRITLLLEGREFHFTAGANQNILEKGLEAGIDLPYSCKGGLCSTCKAKVISGEVIMKHNYTLTDQELAQGYILSCQAYPKSDELKLSYDD